MATLAVRSTRMLAGWALACALVLGAGITPAGAETAFKVLDHGHLAAVPWRRRVPLDRKMSRPLGGRLLRKAIPAD